MQSDEVQRVEKELVDLFRKYLQQKTSGRYDRPLPLDVPGSKGTACRQPDFLLKGKGCPDVIVELKRLMTCDITAEKEAERRVRTAVAEALGLGKQPLPPGYTLVLRSARPRIPIGGNWRSRFLQRLRHAFKKATPARRYESRSRPPFELWRMPTSTQPFAVLALSLRAKRREFIRLVKNADAKRGRALRLPAGGMYVLLFLAAGPSVMTHTEARFWLWRPHLRQPWRPRRVTHIYTVEVCDGSSPHLLVSGLWPATNGMYEKMCDVSEREMVCFNNYAHGKPTKADPPASGAA